MRRRTNIILLLSSEKTTETADRVAWEELITLLRDLKIGIDRWQAEVKELLGEKQDQQQHSKHEPSSGSRVEPRAVVTVSGNHDDPKR